MSASNCACPCPDPTIVEVPGQPGEDGAAGDAGTNGVNAFTLTTTSPIVLPAVAGPVTNPAIQTFADCSWFAVGQVIIISDENDNEWGTFRVLTVASSTGATLEWLDYPGDAAGTTSLAVGSKVSPAGSLAALAAPLPTAVNYTALTTAGAIDNANVAAGVGRSQLFFPHTWIGGTAAVEPVTTLVIPYKFKLISWYFVTEVALVGGGGSRVANMEIGTTDVGTVPSTCTILIAATATGTVTAGTAIAGAQTGNAGDNISIEIAAGGTAFTAGSGTFVIDIANMDTCDSIASLSDHVNDLIVSLT